jgi:hypothetical protein
LEGITNIDVLEDVCTLLDIDPDALGRHIISMGTRDAFVQDVYRLLVEWIVNFINMQLMAGGNAEIGAQISIVEIPSPSGGQNGYGAFVRAWIAETLELQLQQESFDDMGGLNAEMIADAVALLKVNADNNSGIPLLVRINIRMCRAARQSRFCLQCTIINRVTH